MNRKQTLVILLLIGAGIGAYQFYQQLEEERLVKARADTARAVALALKLQRDAAMLTPEQQDKLVSEAKSWLDGGGGQDGGFARAKVNLDRVLKANPRNAQAHIEMARFYIMTGHINYRNFQPGSLEKAAWELDYARQADPNSAEVDVLLGHVYYLRGKPREAVKVLERAEAKGTQSPWLHLNMADALMDLNQWDAAESRLRKAEAQYAAMANPPTRVGYALHEKLSSVFSHQGKLEEADKQYQAQIALIPGNAAGYINYAEFLLFRRGLPDAAMAEAQKALAISDSGMGRLILAATYYAKWAQLKRKAPAEAAEYLALAREGASDFSWMMPMAAQSVDTGPAIQTMVRELMGLGVSINTGDEHGDTGLTLAASGGNVKSVVLLIKYRANIEAANNNGRTAMMNAASWGHTEVVKALAAHNARLNAQDPQGVAALHLAATNGDGDMARTLISLKANVNVATSQGYTPLMSAAFGGAEETVRLLLKAGADPGAVTKDTKQTAADIAMQHGHQALAMFLRNNTKI